MFIVIWHTTVVSGAFNLMLTNVIIWKSCFILKLWFIRVRVSYAAFVMHHIKHCHGQNFPWWILKFLKGNFLKFTRRNENDMCRIHIESTLIQINASFAHWIKVLELPTWLNRILNLTSFTTSESHIFYFSMVEIQSSIDMSHTLVTKVR